MSSATSERFLLEGETVQYETHRHWAILLRPAMWAGGSLLLLSIFFGMTGSTEVTGLLGLGVMFLWLRVSWKIADWRVDALYVTDWRVFSVSGIVTRRLAAMPLRKITDLTYETPPLGRVLGYGRFVIETAGQDQALSRLDYVPDPHRMYSILSHLTLHGATPDSATSTARPSVSIDVTSPGAPGGPPSPSSSSPSPSSPSTTDPSTRSTAAGWVGRLFGGDYDD